MGASCPRREGLPCPSVEEGVATHHSILTWKTPRTEEPGESQSRGHKESGMTERLTHTPLWPRAHTLSRVLLAVTPWTLAHQAPLSTRCSRKEHWSGLPFPPPGGPPDPGVERTSPALAGGLFTTIASWEAPDLVTPTSREHHS